MTEAQQELEVQENDKSVLKQAMKELETEKNGLAMDLGILVKVGILKVDPLNWANRKNPTILLV